VLLIPGFGVSSADAYRWYDGEREVAGGASRREPQYVPGPWPSRAAQMVNDLEVPIARHHPEIDQMKAALGRAGALAAAMTGSGSARTLSIACFFPLGHSISMRASVALPSPKYKRTSLVLR